MKMSMMARAVAVLTLLLARAAPAVDRRLEITLTEARRLGCEPFIIVSQQRSGTGYVIRKLNLHPRVYAGNELLDDVPTFKNRVDVIETLQRGKCSKEQDRVGFKWMTNQEQVGNFDRMGPYLAKTGVKLVYLWRRNVLRQFISTAALKAAHLRLIGEEVDHKTVAAMAHPQTQEILSQVSSFKIRLDVEKLVKHLDRDLALRKAVRKGYKQYGPDIKRITVAYEDLVESSPIYNKTWTTVQEFLGVPVVELGRSTLLLIHGDKPLLAPVSNAASVKKILKKLCKSSRRLEFEAVCEEVETAKCLCDPCECVDEPEEKKTHVRR